MRRGACLSSERSEWGRICRGGGGGAKGRGEESERARVQRGLHGKCVGLGDGRPCLFERAKRPRLAVKGDIDSSADLNRSW